jgi:hypothetical protein
VKTIDVSDFSHELRGKNFSDASKFHDNGIFRQRRCKLLHLTSDSSKAFSSFAYIISTA